MDLVDWDIVWEKGDGRIVDVQGERHLFCCRYALNHGKSFDVGKLEQPVRVLVERRELIHW